MAGEESKIVKSKILDKITAELNKAADKENYYSKDPTYDAYVKNDFIKGAPPTHYEKAG